MATAPASEQANRLVYLRYRAACAPAQRIRGPLSLAVCQILQKALGIAGPTSSLFPAMTTKRTLPLELQSSGYPPSLRLCANCRAMPSILSAFLKGVSSQWWADTNVASTGTPPKMDSPSATTSSLLESVLLRPMSMFLTTTFVDTLAPASLQICLIALSTAF